MSNSPNAKGSGTMIDCGRCEMGNCAMSEIRCPECVVAVTETRNVTARLGQAELQALRVLANAGLVPPLTRVLADQTARTWVFPDTKAS
jgi:hypothetical protein